MKNILVFIVIILTFGCNHKPDCCEYSISDEKIIGHWVEYAVNDTLSTYDFYQNGTWTRSTEPESGRKSKGKYIVAPDGAIFMRHLGSRHWPSNNNIDKDIRTSIEAFVLFLEDSIRPGKTLLINNQEDYETAWIKK